MNGTPRCSAVADNDSTDTVERTLEQQSASAIFQDAIDAGVAEQTAAAGLCHQAARNRWTVAVSDHERDDQASPRMERGGVSSLAANGLPMNACQ